MTNEPETGNPQGETPEEPLAPSEETPETGATAEERIANMEKALRKANHEAAANRKKLEAFEAAEREKREAEMSELEKAQSRARELESELAVLRLSEMRRQAASEAGIPAEFAERLKGETLEALKADADQLASILPKSSKTPPPVPPTNPGNASKGETDDQRRARIYGSNVNLFDPKFAEEHGGGVRFISKE